MRASWENEARVIFVSVVCVQAVLFLSGEKEERMSEVRSGLGQ